MMPLKGFFLIAKAKWARTHLISLCLAIALSVACILPVSADFSFGDWKYFRDITLPLGLENRDLIEVGVDKELFGDALEGLADLRIVEKSTSQEVPYKLLVEKGYESRASIAILGTEIAHATFVVDVGKSGLMHNEIDLLAVSQNFQRRVSVEGSSDNRTWEILSEQSVIFDLTIGEDNPEFSEEVYRSRNTLVGYRDSKARYLRVHIFDNPGQLPLEIRGARVYFSERIFPKSESISSDSEVMEERLDGGKSKTVIVLDVGVEKVPTHQLEINVVDENYYRRVDLEASEDKSKWASIQNSEAIYGYNTAKFQGKKLHISYPESTERYFRITIFNEDNANLTIEAVNILSYSRKMIFQPTEDGEYRLYYGNPKARHPSYDFEQVFPYFVTDNLPVGLLGRHSESLDFYEEQSLWERYPWLLNTIIVVAAVGVGIFLANLLRQIRKYLPPPA